MLPTPETCFRPDQLTNSAAGEKYNIFAKRLTLLFILLSCLLQNGRKNKVQ
jgi:hypothetical protein